MIYVDWIESNVKGGIAAKLGPRTLILGPSRAGKSAIVNSVELAVHGSASDIAGRTEVAREIDLMALAPDRKGELFARAHLSDGTDSTWHVGGKGGKKAQHNLSSSVDKATVLPLWPVRGAVLGNAETARKFFLQYAVGVVTEADVLGRLPSDLHTLYRKAILGTMTTTSVLDKLLASLTYAKKQARAAKDRVKASQAVASAQAQGLPPLPTDDMIRALKAEKKAAQAALDAHNQALGAAQNREQSQAALEATRVEGRAASAAAEELRSTRDALANTLATIPPPTADDGAITANIAAIQWHAENNQAACLCCGAQAAPGVFASRFGLAQNFLSTLAQERQHHDAVKDQLGAAELNYQIALRKIEELRARVAALVEVTGGALGEALPTTAAVQEAQDRVSRADAELQRLDALKASWAASRKAVDGAGDAESEQAQWSKLADACLGAVSALLDTGVHQFIARVQAHLPDTMAFDLNLRDGEREVFQMGFLEKGQLHTALSGAEWTMMLAAVAGACRGDPSKLSIVIPEERMMDPVTLRLACEAFGALDSQVILASAIAPDTIPIGWHVIDTAKGEHTVQAQFSEIT